MKLNHVLVGVAVVAGFLAGLAVTTIIPPAHGAYTVIEVSGGGAMASRCDFGKSIVYWANTFYCVKR